MWQNLPLWPTQASTNAPNVDLLFLFLLSVSAFFTLIIFATIAVFAIKYRASKHPKAVQIEGSNLLEITWSAIPLMIAMVMFVWGASIYFNLSRAPKNAIKVWVVGKQWMWKFQHEGGQREIDVLHVPVNQPVQLIMTSQDVIHDLFIPDFRIKGDVLPGRYTRTWFEATKTGTYHLFCSQYCGTMHSGMIGEVVVMSQKDYEDWLRGGGEDSMGVQGMKLFRHFECIACHRADSGARGPDLAGLYGKNVNLSDGRTVTADENYIRESIIDPKAKIVAGFQPIMPTFKGQMTEEELAQLVSYIESMNELPQNVNPNAPQPTDQDMPYRNNPNAGAPPAAGAAAPAQK